MGAPAFEAVQFVRSAVAHREVTPGLLDVFLALFDGHDLPALWWSHHRRPGFYKSPGMGKRLIFEAHLLGVVMAGAYPFRGVSPWCDCRPKMHTCVGGGTRYICIDIDDKERRGDTESRVRDVVAMCWRAGLTPVVFSSRSGVGAHVFVFLDEPVGTRVAYSAGRTLALAAGLTERVDIIPSAEHYAGFGTLHALPLSPLAEAGGGVLFDAHLSPVSGRDRIVSALWWAHTNRSSAQILTAVANGDVPCCQAHQHVPAIPRVAPGPREEVKLSKKDAALLKAIRKSHPQFRRVIASSAESWRGKRSSRDAYLVSYMRRQGMSAEGIVAAMLKLPNTKAAQRGEEFAWALVEAQGTKDALVDPLLAGEPLRPRAAKRQRQEAPWAPWDARVAPPREYGERASPWWEVSVQARLSEGRSRLDGIVLAHLIDRYYRGPEQIRRRMFFASLRGLGKRLALKASSLQNVIGRLRERFPDVLRVVPGVPHPTLRIAHGYYVPERTHYDKLDWYVPQNPVRLP